MESYRIQKTESDNYDLYEILIENKIKYCYYEKVGNRFASHVYIFFFDHCYMDSFLENSIYFFSRDFRKIGEFIAILRQEFSNLEFCFVIQDESERAGVEKFISDLKMEIDILDVQEYFNRNKLLDRMVVSNGQYACYDLRDNPFLKKGLEENNKFEKEVDKSFADYNGFNERLIDSNVKNIVHIKRSSGGDRNEL